MIRGVVHADGLPTPQRWWAMLAIAIGIAMSVLDSAIANIALPAIARELHAAPAQVVLVVNGYQLAVVVVLLPLASLGERLGYRRVYIAGLLVFTAGSLACALSSTLPALVLSRALQGLGAAGIMSVNGALVRFTYPQAMLGRGVGLNALVVSIAAALGPTIASAILALGPWEWLFAVNVPLGLLNVVLASRALPWSPRSTHAFDWPSAALNAIAFGLFFVGANAIGQSAQGGWIAAGTILAAFVAGYLLLRREAGGAAPLIPVDLLGIPVFRLSILASICAFSAYALAFLALPFYFQSVLHFDQVTTGLLMTPWPVGVGLMAPLAGRLSDRIPAGLLGAVGMGLLAIGLALLATLPPQADAWDISWRMTLCGIGFGWFQAPNNRTMLLAAPRARAGAAGGMLATARLTGMTSGATLGAIAFALAPQGAEPVLLLIGAALAVAAGVASVLRLPAQRREGNNDR